MSRLNVGEFVRSLGRARARADVVVRHLANTCRERYPRGVETSVRMLEQMEEAAGNLPADQLEALLAAATEAEAHAQRLRREKDVFVAVATELRALYGEARKAAPECESCGSKLTLYGSERAPFCGLCGLRRGKED